MITIIDYGIGNLGSIANALTRLGKNFQISSSPSVVEKATALILPGVGAAGKGMENLKKLGLDKVIGEQIKIGCPFLGICLGMQLLFDFSEEGNVECLKILRGKVKKFQKTRKIPQVGWNQVIMQNTNLKTSRRSWPPPQRGPVQRRETSQTAGQNDNSKLKILFNQIPNDSYFYFVNSYYCDPFDKSIIVGNTEYGETFPSIIAKDNIVATQFHPERSSKAGLQLLKNFWEAAC